MIPSLIGCGVAHSESWTCAEGVENGGQKGMEEMNRLKKWRQLWVVAVLAWGSLSMRGPSGRSSRKSTFRMTP